MLFHANLIFREMAWAFCVYEAIITSKFIRRYSVMKRFFSFFLCMVLVAVPVVSSTAATDTNSVSVQCIFPDGLECY